MARGITEQEVFEAADALLARGERPTIERVRGELGRGSPNTVNPMLDAWWASLAARLSGAQAPGLPPSLVQACGRLYEGCGVRPSAKASASRPSRPSRRRRPSSR